MKNIFIITFILFAFQSQAKDIKLFPKWFNVLERQSIIGGDAVTSYQKLEDVYRETPGRYISDKNDYWKTPKEFILEGGGDCEDWAIYWYYTARRMGFATKDLRIWIGYLTAQPNIHHALLTARINDTWYVLDIYNNSIIGVDTYFDSTFSGVYYFNELGWDYII